MKTSLTFKIILTAIIVFILMCWLLFKFQDIYYGDYLDTNYDMAYEGEVVDIKRNRGSVYIELNNGEKYNVIDSYNCDYKPRSFYNQVDIGDLLNKPLNTDSLFVTKNEEEYFFVLGKDINCD